jgi:hypothetical protein
MKSRISFAAMPSRFGLLLGITFVLTTVGTCMASTIWNGPLISFSKANGADGTLPANQDRMTPDIWFARGSSQGLFNAHSEGSFTHFSSPAGTQWADGTLANFATLTYHDWNTWAKSIHGGPPSTVGVNAVVHLVPDDIYFSIKFTAWGGSGAGGFSYQRSTPVVPEPSITALLIAGIGAASISLKRRNR